MVFLQASRNWFAVGANNSAVMSNNEMINLLAWPLMFPGQIAEPAQSFGHHPLSEIYPVSRGVESCQIAEGRVDGEKVSRRELARPSS